MRRHDQGKLFYEFRLDDRIPQNLSEWRFGTISRDDRVLIGASSLLIN